jgi:hypothetical protein
VCAKSTDSLARLNEQGLVVLERGKLTGDDIEGIPRSCRFTRPAVNDELTRTLCNLGVQIVAQHPKSSFLHPPLARKLRPSRRAYRPRLFQHGPAFVSTGGGSAARPSGLGPKNPQLTRTGGR